MVSSAIQEELQINKNGVEELSDLKCEQHEEADSSVFTHINYFAPELVYQRVIVQATDTDTIILGMYYSCIIPVD